MSTYLQINCLNERDCGEVFIEQESTGNFEYIFRQSIFMDIPVQMGTIEYEDYISTQVNWAINW